MPFHIDLVQRVKDDLGRAGVNLSGPCGAFEITRRVAWLLQDEGWGLIAVAPPGTNCNGFSVDKMVNRPLVLFVDCLEDAGGKNGAVWQERPATPAEIAAWRAPLPFDVPPSPSPNPSPADPPAVPGLPEFAKEFFDDFERLVNGVSDLAAAMRAQNEILVKIQTNGIPLRLR